MVDVTTVLSTDTPDVAESAPAETQLAEAGRTVTVTEPQPQVTTVQLLSPDEALQLDFDPAAVAKAEIKDGNLEITFDNGGVVVIRGYEAWAEVGGQASGPQGGVVDMAQLMGAPAAAAATPDAAPEACAAPAENANVVDVPVPAAGERITLTAQPGDALRLACSFRDVAGQEVGDTLEMTFPGGGIVVVENFSAWAAAAGATITDCVCGGINLADFIVALGMVPEDILPAAGEAQGGPQGNDLTGSGFTPDPGPQILTGLPYPHILPPTALGYGVPEPDQGIFPEDDDLVPTVSIPTAGAVVFEKGLPSRNGEPEGSGEAADPAPDTDPSEIITGSILFTGGDGPAKITIGGVVIDSAGDTVQGAFGVLEITSIDSDSIEYKYTLSDNILDNSIRNNTFAVEIADKDGDKATGNLVIDIVDDAPTANDDTDSIPGGQFGPVTGNVITDAEGDGGKDTVGADNAKVSAVLNADTGDSDSAGGSFTVNGLYGVLTVNEDGSYSYLRSQGTPGGVQDVFTYTLKDGDGDTDTATLTISIGDDVPTVDIPVAGEAGTRVFEKGLQSRNGEPEGSGEAADPAANSDQSEITSGSILFTDGDAPATIKIGGVAVDSAGDTVQGAFGVLEITGIDGDSVEYKYTLSDNTSGDATKDTFAVEIADKDGDKAAGNLVIDIVDDVPTAINDTDSIPSGQFGPATGNVITDAEGDGGKDTVGADNALVTKVSSNNVGGFDDVTDGGNFVLAGQYGVLTLNPDGTYSYQRNPGTPGGVQDVFTYTLTDGDGDTDTATLTISIGDDTPTVDIPTAGEAGTQVFEKGLPSRNGEPEGSGEAANPAPNSDQSEITSGSILFTDGDAPAKISIGGVAIDSAGDTVQGAFGVLEVTGIDGDSVEYKYTLSDNTSGNDTEDTFTVEIADKDGDKATGSLVIDIVDDVPTANDDTDGIPSGQFGPATGNVITDAEGDGGKDTVGADNAKVSAVSNTDTGDSDSDGGSFTVNGLYGVLTINEDGSYSYQRNPGTPGGVQDVFTYTLTDGDGDTDTATLTISIGDDTPTVDIPTAGEAGTQVFEKGLPSRNGEPEGSGEAANPAPNSDQSEITSGSIQFTDGDAPAKISIGGVVVDSAGDTVQGAFGVLEVTGIDGDSVEYKYTLSDNTSGNDTEDTFTVEIADKDGDKATGNLVIDIVDDVPTANDDTDSVGAGGKATGNVITGTDTTSDGPGDDVVGADNAVVTDIDFGAIDGTVGGAIAGNFGTLIINADGSYEYQAKANVSGTDVFTYTLKDGDGDTETATLTINVPDSKPTVNPATDTVDEAALDLNKSGNDLAPGTTTGSNPSSTDETETGTLVFSDSDGASITKITFNGSDFTDAGDGSADGFINVNTPLGMLKVNTASGDYTYTLEDNSLAHNTQGTGLDGVNESFTYTVEDTLGNSNSSSLVIGIQDDVPIAYNNEQCTAERTFNLVYVADVSGSMDDDDVDPNTAGKQTRIELMKQALTNMTQQYALLGTEITLTIVAFASGAVTADSNSDKDGARVSQTFTFNDASDQGYLDALAFISSLQIGFQGLNTETEYDDALLTAQDLLTGQLAAQPLDGGPDNIVYLLSDGKPNPASNDAPAGWVPFVNINDVEVIAVGIGKDIPVNDPDLAEVEDNGDTPINVANELDLNQTLLDTVPGPISGNVITDPAEVGSGSPVGSVDTGGADGIARIASITHDGITYTLSADGTTMTTNPPGAIFTYNAATGELSFQTDLGGNLTIDLLGAGMGDYTYNPPLAVKHGAPGSATDDEVTEVFTYTIQDGDGDKASANLQICIEDGEPVAVDDHKIIGTKTFGSGNVLTDGTDDTFGPDGPASPAITQVKFGNTVFTDGSDGTVDGVIHATGALGSLTLDANTGAYTYVRNAVQSTGTDVFEYTIKDGDGDTDTADLTIDLAPLNILNGTFVTNTNSVDQPLILTFQEVSDPTHFSSQVYSLNAQGQQGTVAQDVGFFIDSTQQFVYAVEAGKTTDFTNINVTDFSLEGAVINAPGGSDNWAIRYDDGGPSASGAGGRHLAMSGVVTFSPATEIEQDAESIDGDKNANSIDDPADATDNNGLDYIHGAAGNDTLAGGNSEPDILNGGAGADQVSGGSGNDILVFDKADVATSGDTSGFIDGGAGADVLRVDDGALAIFFNQANPIIDLRGADIDNIEVIGLTEEAVSDATKGTTIKLEADDVIDFSGDALGSNTLYIVGSQGDKLQLATTGSEGWVDGDGNAGNGITKTGTFDDGQGQVFDIYTTETGGKLYVDTDIAASTVNS